MRGTGRQGFVTAFRAVSPQGAQMTTQETTSIQKMSKHSDPLLAVIRGPNM